MDEIKLYFHGNGSHLRPCSSTFVEINVLMDIGPGVRVGLKFNRKKGRATSPQAKLSYIRTV